MKIFSPAPITYFKSGFKFEVTGVGTVTIRISQFSTARLVSVVIFQFFELGFGMILLISGSPVGFSPLRMVSTTC